MVKTFVESSGSQTTPFTDESLEEEIRRLLGLGAEEDLPGFRKFCEAFRDRQRKSLFIADRGDIAEDEVFEYHQSCRIMHPGLCVEEDAVRMPLIKDLCDRDCFHR